MDARRTGPRATPHSSDLWQTPPELYAALNAEFRFNFDPCPANWRGAPDGLSIPWGTSTFCNPPYSATSRWVRKAHAEWRQGRAGKTVVL